MLICIVCTDRPRNRCKANQPTSRHLIGLKFGKLTHFRWKYNISSPPSLRLLPNFDILLQVPGNMDINLKVSESRVQIGVHHPSQYPTELGIISLNTIARVCYGGNFQQWRSYFNQINKSNKKRKVIVTPIEM